MSLTNTNIKIFASDDSAKTVPINSFDISTSSKDPDVVQAGYENGIKQSLLPANGLVLEHANSILFNSSRQHNVILESGIVDYLDNVEYKKDSLIYNNGKLYISEKNANKGNDLTDATWWKMCIDFNASQSSGKNITPDISRIVSQSVNTIYEATEDGYVIGGGNVRWNGNAHINCSVNSDLSGAIAMYVIGAGYYDADNVTGYGIAPVKKGTYYRVDGARVSLCQFIPIKGDS